MNIVARSNIVMPTAATNELAQKLAERRWRVEGTMPVTEGATQGFPTTTASSSFHQEPPIHRRGSSLVSSPSSASRGNFRSVSPLQTAAFNNSTVFFPQGRSGMRAPPFPFAQRELVSPPPIISKAKAPPTPSRPNSTASSSGSPQNEARYEFLQVLHTLRRTTDGEGTGDKNEQQDNKVMQPDDDMTEPTASCTSASASTRPGIVSSTSSSSNSSIFGNIQESDVSTIGHIPAAPLAATIARSPPKVHKSVDTYDAASSFVNSQPYNISHTNMPFAVGPQHPQYARRTSTSSSGVITPKITQQKQVQSHPPSAPGRVNYAVVRNYATRSPLQPPHPFDEEEGMMHGVVSRHSPVSSRPQVRKYHQHHDKTPAGNNATLDDASVDSITGEIRTPVYEDEFDSEIACVEEEGKQSWRAHRNHSHHKYNSNHNNTNNLYPAETKQVHEFGKVVPAPPPLPDNNKGNELVGTNIITSQSNDSCSSFAFSAHSLNDPAADHAQVCRPAKIGNAVANDNTSHSSVPSGLTINVLYKEIMKVRNQMEDSQRADARKVQQLMDENRKLEAELEEERARVAEKERTIHELVRQLEEQERQFVARNKSRRLEGSGSVSPKSNGGKRRESRSSSSGRPRRHDESQARLAQMGPGTDRRFEC